MRLDRRTLLRRAGLAATGLLLGGGLAAQALDWRRGGPTAPVLARGAAQSIDLPGLPPYITPSGQFYTVSKNLFGDPQLDAARWRLRVTGAVERALELDLDAVRALPSVTQLQTLECIDNQVGGDLISNAEWRGARLADVLQQAGLRAGVRRIVFVGADDYSDSIPLDKALEPTTLLAYEMNGQPLPPQHGFPLRVLAPNLYGIKNPKWVVEIRAVTEDYRGFWQRRGWTNDGTIQTMSRIDVPANRATVPAGPQRVGGIAFAGARGIQAVEISGDEGRTWQPASLITDPASLAWVFWVADWTPQGSTPSLIVRATDGTGTLQSAEVRPTLPDGATGYHRISVRLS
ncbi:MAG TPA: molybdopterin-dependent oxidoreductase [Chloroflexota bacterium]|nr:molybdopterin-dependent oxidoreductase [Chloroflexota bacterium]